MSLVGFNASITFIEGCPQITTWTRRLRRKRKYLSKDPLSTFVVQCWCVLWDSVFELVSSEIQCLGLIRVSSPLANSYVQHIMASKLFTVATESMPKFSEKSEALEPRSHTFVGHQNVHILVFVIVFSAASQSRPDYVFSTLCSR